MPAPRLGSPRKDILGQVNAFAGLAHAATQKAEELVEHVGVAVVHAHRQRPVQRALADRHERVLLQRHDVAERIQRACDDGSRECPGCPPFFPTYLLA